MPRILLVAEANVSAEQRRVFEAMIAGQRISAPVGPPAIAMHPPPRRINVRARPCPPLQLWLRTAVARVRYSVDGPLLRLPVRMGLARGGSPQRRLVAGIHRNAACRWFGVRGGGRAGDPRLRHGIAGEAFRLRRRLPTDRRALRRRGSGRADRSDLLLRNGPADTERGGVRSSRGNDAAPADIKRRSARADTRVVQGRDSRR